MSKSCFICNYEKDNFYTCIQCKNQHCLDCNKRVNKCPFCRHIFRENNIPENNMPDVEFDFAVVQGTSINDLIDLMGRDDIQNMNDVIQWAEQRQLDQNWEEQRQRIEQRAVQSGERMGVRTEQRTEERTDQYTGSRLAFPFAWIPYNETRINYNFDRWNFDE